MFFSTYNFYLPTTDLLLYQVCTEKWAAPMHRFLYTLLLMFVQYVIPIGTILVTHTKIIRIVKVREPRNIKQYEKWLIYSLMWTSVSLIHR